MGATAGLAIGTAGALHKVTGRIAKGQRSREIPKPAPVAVADADESGTKKRVRKKAKRRFNRDDTLLAGNEPLGTNPNAKTLLGL